MPWKLPTLNTALEWTGIAALAVWGIYKKEIQESLNAWGKRCYAAWFVRPPAGRLSDAQWKEILQADLGELETLLYVLLNEYDADRVTVTEYSAGAGSHLATCAVEVRKAEMQSVRAMQGRPLAPAVWAEIEAIHRGPGRTRYVADAHLLDVAPLRTVLLNSGVWSAHYQSLSTGPEPQAVLSLSWHAPHPLTPAQLAALYVSGVACAAVWRNMERLRAT